MTIRYTDFNTGNDPPPDFVIRKHGPSLWALAAIFLGLLVVSIMVMVTVLDKRNLIILLSTLMAAAGWYMTILIQRSHDLVMATEFQNALFASALDLNNKFCLIIKREGNIVYMDTAFQSMFPDLLKEQHMSVASMLKHGKVETTDREKVFAAIERGVAEKVTFDIRSSDNRINKIMMSIEPILRPTGFILLRAREYIEQRTANNTSTNVTTGSSLSPANLNLFASVMDKMTMGVYMTDPAGNLIYANTTLEQWLNFNNGEMASGALSLKDIVHHSGTKPITITPGNFEGEITLQKKEGGMIKTFVNQKIIEGGNQNALGCVLLLHNLFEQDVSTKKKLW